MKETSPKKVGRKVDVKMVDRVQELKKKGLSFREIAKLVGKDVKTVHDWYKRVLV